jgi:hypothetical protein
MSKQAAKKPRKPRAQKAQRQAYLVADMAPPKVAEIDLLASEYVKVRNERMSLTEEETEAQDRLRAAMREHSLTTYEYDEDGVAYVVSLNNTEKVRVSRKKAPESNGEA